METRKCERSCPVLVHADVSVVCDRLWSSTYNFVSHFCKPVVESSLPCTQTLWGFSKMASRGPSERFTTSPFAALLNFIGRLLWFNSSGVGVRSLSSSCEMGTSSPPLIIMIGCSPRKRRLRKRITTLQWQKASFETSHPESQFFRED